MADFTVDEMLEMQRRLQETYRDKWGSLSPERGKAQLLWLIAELGEAIDILKKKRTAAVMEDAETRAHFIEEMADVLMYYMDILLCYGITSDDLKQAYTEKFQRNLTRW